MGVEILLKIADALGMKRLEDAAKLRAVELN
jgi:hypothetical protein